MDIVDEGESASIQERSEFFYFFIQNLVIPSAILLATPLPLSLEGILVSKLVSQDGTNDDEGF